MQVIAQRAQFGKQNINNTFMFEDFPNARAVWTASISTL